MPIAVQAKARHARHILIALRHHGERVAPQLKPNDLKDAREPKRQAKKGIMEGPIRQSKPPVVPNKASTGARTGLTPECLNFQTKH